MVKTRAAKGSANELPESDSKPAPKPDEKKEEQPKKEEPKKEEGGSTEEKK